MLKSTATANKTRKQGELEHRLHCSWFDWFFWQWLKKDQNTDWKKKSIFVKNIVLTKNWFVVSIFYEFPEHYIEK